MTFKIACLFGLAFLWSSCSRKAQPPPASVIPPDQGGAAGYRHGIDHSKFSVGGGQHYAAEFGFLKVVGSDGTFAVDATNGLAVATLNAHSAGAQRTAWFSQSPDQHNQLVMNYFVSAGVPKEQVGGVHATTFLAASASGDQVPAPQPAVAGYQSILHRKVGDIPVVDSVAWARMDDNAMVLAEWVYWPAIPGRVITEATRMKQVLAADQERQSFLAKLPVGLPPGNLVIRHSSATATGAFTAVASYDVPERRSPPPQPNVGGGAIIVMRHFGADGTELRLPQEQRKIVSDYPTATRTPRGGGPR